MDHFHEDGEGAVDAVLLTREDPRTTGHRRVPAPHGPARRQENCETREVAMSSDTVRRQVAMSSDTVRQVSNDIIAGIQQRTRTTGPSSVLLCDSQVVGHFGGEGTRAVASREFSTKSDGVRTGWQRWNKCPVAVGDRLRLGWQRRCLQWSRAIRIR